MIRKYADLKTEVRDRMRGGSGSVTIKHFFEQSEFTAKARLCAKLIIPPGAGIGQHQHVGEDEVYLVLRGTGILDDGKVQTRISTGDAVLTGNGGSHAVTNNGQEDLEIIAMIMCYSNENTSN